MSGWASDGPDGAHMPGSTGALFMLEELEEPPVVVICKDAAVLFVGTNHNK